MYVKAWDLLTFGQKPYVTSQQIYELIEMWFILDKLEYYDIICPCVLQDGDTKAYF